MPIIDNIVIPRPAPAEAAEADGEDDKPFDYWCCLEVMGYRKVYGRVTEQELGGAKLLRIDVPNGNGGFQATQFYGASSVYCLTPMTEEAVIRGLGLKPKEPTLLEAPKPTQPTQYDDHFDDYDDDGDWPR